MTWLDMVLEAGFEPATTTMSRWHSTAELLEHEFGGEHRSRTESGVMPNVLLSRQPPSLTGLLSKFMAEKEGFEPSSQVSLKNTLAGCRHKPLAHFSRKNAPSLRLLRRRHSHKP